MGLVCFWSMVLVVLVWHSILEGILVVMVEKVLLVLAKETAGWKE